jgi:hypothetical protein
MDGAAVMTVPDNHFYVVLCCDQDGKYLSYGYGPFGTLEIAYRASLQLNLKCKVRSYPHFHIDQGFRKMEYIAGKAELSF